MCLIGSEGYLGSALVPVLLSNFEVCTLDLKEAKVFDEAKQHLTQDFRGLSKKQLCEFDVIILLAAHSSVRQTLDDPIGAISNNVVAFAELLRKLSKHQVLIYASSGSVYDGYGGSYPSEESAILSSKNLYDMTKLTNEIQASACEIKTVGLRFGTISGPSTTFRRELIINKMTLDAKNHKQIQLSNEESFRSCLDIRDAVNSILSLLDSLNKLPIYSLFNLASYSMKIQDIANQISQTTGAEIVKMPPSAAYNFTMRTDKFEKVNNFRFKHGLQSTIESILSHE